MKTVDARGRACPEPVLLAKRALEQTPAESLQVLVDSPIARDNVSRFLRKAGCQVDVRPEEGVFLILAARQEK